MHCCDEHKQGKQNAGAQKASGSNGWMNYALALIVLLLALFAFGVVKL